MAAAGSTRGAAPAVIWGTPDLSVLSRPCFYSPSRAESESHPIRQRLGQDREESPPALGAASEVETTSPLARFPDQLSLVQKLQGRSPHDAAMMEPSVKEGDSVSWQWSGSRPGGTVTQVATSGAVTMETKNNNVVSKNAEPDNPAVYIERSGHDVVKKASEIQVEEPGDKHKEDQGEEKTVGKEKTGEPQTGKKRAAEDPEDEKEEDEAKKQKTDEEPKANGEKPKKRGRPAKDSVNGEKKAGKKRAPKKAATESGEPRRSGRVAAKSS